MKFYQVRYMDDAAAPGSMFNQVWLGTQADVRATVKQAKADMMRGITTHEVDVPTDKPGLLAFLNERQVR